MKTHTISIGITQVYNVTVEAQEDEEAIKQVEILIADKGIRAALNELNARDCSIFDNQDILVQWEGEE